MRHSASMSYMHALWQLWCLKEGGQASRESSYADVHAPNRWRYMNSLTITETRISNYIQRFLYDVATYLCLNFNGKTFLYILLHKMQYYYAIISNDRQKDNKMINFCIGKYILDDDTNGKWYNMKDICSFFRLEVSENVEICILKMQSKVSAFINTLWATLYRCYMSLNCCSQVLSKAFI